MTRKEYISYDKRLDHDIAVGDALYRHRFDLN